MHKTFRRILYLFAALAITYLLLLIPDGGSHAAPAGAGNGAFAWKQDSNWLLLEEDFRSARKLDKPALDSSLASLKAKAIAALQRLESKQSECADSGLYALQQQFFQLAPLVAVQQHELEGYLAFYNRFRNYVKQQSAHWNIQEACSRSAVYRLLYGLRAATEEVLLQSTHSRNAAAMAMNHVPTATPATKVFGMEVHSGDILVSRGGAKYQHLFQGVTITREISAMLLYCMWMNLPNNPM